MYAIDLNSFNSLKASQFEIISQFIWITPKTKGRQADNPAAPGGTISCQSEKMQYGTSAEKYTPRYRY